MKCGKTPKAQKGLAVSFHSDVEHQFHKVKINQDSHFYYYHTSASDRQSTSLVTNEVALNS